MKIFHIFLFLIWGVCVIKCENENQKWWQSTSIYEVYPRSFKDSDGDGVGDIKGIISKLDYLKEIGTEVIRITHLYKTSNRDFDRYEILNHKEIDSAIGTLEDFEELVKEAHKKGLKIMIDFVPNHTSSSHPYFLNSIHKDPIYSDYYIWVNGSQNEPPTDWQNAFRSSAWDYHQERKEWYYHILSPDQPDLNLRNPKVVEELKKILRFWLSKMVDGFFLTEANYLIEDDQLREESIHNINLPDSAKLVYEFKKEIEEYGRERRSDRILIAHMAGTHSYSINESDGQEIPSSHLVFRGSIFNKHYEKYLISISMRSLTLFLIKRKFSQGEASKIWAIDTLGTRRITGVLDEEVSDVITGLTALMPGVMYTYYGSELGIHGRIEPNPYYYVEHLGYYDDQEDAIYAEKLPMQWNNEDNAGFTTALSPWINNNPEYWIYNVKSEELDLNSHLNYYKKLMSLRKSPTLTHGEVENYENYENIYAFSRIYLGHESYIVISNFDYETRTIDLEKTLVIRNDEIKSNVIGKAVANQTSLFIVASTGNSLHKPSDVITRNSEGQLLLTMRPRSQVILSDRNIIEGRMEEDKKKPFLDFSNIPVKLVFLITAIGLILLQLKWIFN